MEVTVTGIYNVLMGGGGGVQGSVGVNMAVICVIADEQLRGLHHTGEPSQISSRTGEKKSNA